MDLRGDWIKKQMQEKIIKIKIARGKDKEVVRVVENIKKAGIKVLRGDK